MSPERRAELEECQLKYIQALIQADDPSSNLLRSFADNWFAYSRGDPFLTKGGRPRWWNNPNRVQHGAMLRSMHGASEAAANVMMGRGEDRLAVDHAVPLWAIRAELRRLQPGTAAGVREVLDRYYRLVVITHPQHVAITRADCARRTGSHHAALDWQATYAEAGVELVGSWEDCDHWRLR